jgi:hypothetical protein
VHPANPMPFRTVAGRAASAVPIAPPGAIRVTPRQVLVLAAAAASTVWWQLPVLPGQLLGEGQGPSSLAVADILAAVTALASLLVWVRVRRRPSLRPLGLALPGLLVVGLAAAGAAQAPDPLLAIGVTVHLALLWLLYLTLANGIVGPPALALALAGGLLIQAPFAIVQTVRQTTWPLHVLLGWPSDFAPGTAGASVLLGAGGARWLRAYGPFYHPNILGGYLALELVLLIGGVGVLWTRLPSAMVRLLLGLPVGIALVCLTIAASRGAWLAATVGTLTLVAGGVRSAAGKVHSQWPGRWSAIGAASLAAAVLAAGFALFRPPLLERFNPQSNRLEEQSVQERLFFDQVGLHLLATHPWLGVGAGNVDLAEAAYFHGADIPLPVHNVPLLMAVELGPGGALAWAVAAGSILWQTWRRPDWWTVVFASALVAIGTAGLFDHYFWRFPTARTTVVVLAGAWAAALRAGQRRRLL